MVLDLPLSMARKLVRFGKSSAPHAQGDAGRRTLRVAFCGAWHGRVCGARTVWLLATRRRAVL